MLIHQNQREEQKKENKKRRHPIIEYVGNWRQTLDRIADHDEMHSFWRANNSWNWNIHIRSFRPPGRISIEVILLGNTKSLHLPIHKTLQRQQGLHNVVEPGSSGWCRITAKSTGIHYIHSYIYIYLAQGVSHGIAMCVVDWIKQPASKSGGSMATCMWRPVSGR